LKINEEKFYTKVAAPDEKGCMKWLGAKSPQGYGTLYVCGHNMQLAHRVLYEIRKGKIPYGSHLSHLCNNRLCINPEHLLLKKVAK
jgi:hypothetical protein